MNFNKLLEDYKLNAPPALSQENYDVLRQQFAPVFVLLHNALKDTACTELHGLIDIIKAAFREAGHFNSLLLKTSELPKNMSDSVLLGTTTLGVQNSAFSNYILRLYWVSGKIVAYLTKNKSVMRSSEMDAELPADRE